MALRIWVYSSSNYYGAVRTLPQLPGSGFAFLAGFRARPFSGGSPML